MVNRLYRGRGAQAVTTTSTADKKIWKIEQTREQLGWKQIYFE